jgi:hypothetical protein
MPKVLFTVNYSIESDRLPEYEELVRRMTKINTERGAEYMVFMDKNNNCTEVTIYSSEEAFNESDELMDDPAASEYINRINAMAINMTYSTKYEVGSED